MDVREMVLAVDADAGRLQSTICREGAAQKHRDFRFSKIEDSGGAEEVWLICRLSRL